MDMNTIIKIIYLLTLCFSAHGQFIEGISVVGPFNDDAITSHFPALKQLGTEWLAFTPDYILTNNEFTLSIDSSDWSLDMERLGLNIAAAHNAGYKVFLKPHIVLSKDPSQKGFQGDVWRGTLKLRDHEWRKVEKTYQSFILSFARFAEQHGVELFCIGTELSSFVDRRKAYWISLINDIRSLYSGRITYSANWDDYMADHIWTRVDLIGVNAYFPLGSQKKINSKFLAKKWSHILKPIKKMAQKYDKPVLITEIGYRSVRSSSSTPWIHNNPAEKISEKTQSTLLHHMLEAIYNTSYITGCFIWNYPYSLRSEHNTDFSIRNKQAFHTIARWYNK